ncbi:uncharacterized protein LOC134820352 isoform X2 [Bolinopsis microptera]|uniref:uncharacterized protein LOC134820352 isoform X2 n=1 Tax=Bolinopsis microptera TaxID=2820187 RepID=UPI003079F50E
MMHTFGLEDHYTSKIFAKGLKSGKNEDEKSFNRYVRQLVDQYLDKEVVISKQPEDKVELIVQACREKFPEFAHWTTTRIRIYIESCRRLKKIKNSPLLLAKRKAAGRRFREGQKLKKIIASQYSMQAAEANRQLAEYLIRNGRTVNQVKPKRLSPYSPQQFIEEQINAIGIKTEGVQIKNESSTSPYMDGKEGYTQMPSITLQNQSINPVLSSLMNMTPSSLQPPSMLDRHTITPPNIPISKLSPLGTPLPTMAPSFNPHQVVPPRVVSPRTPTASPPTMMSNTLFNKPSLFKSPQEPFNDAEMAQPEDSTESSVSDAIGKVISAMLQNEKSKQTEEAKQNTSTPKSCPWSITGSPVQQERQILSPLSPPRQRDQPQLSPKQKSFQIESLMNSSQKEVSQGANTTGITVNTSPLRLPLSLEKHSVMSMTEILNAKTLVTSYREAANFLYRAASELEQLLPNDHRVF